MPRPTIILYFFLSYTYQNVMLTVTENNMEVATYEFVLYS